MKRFATDGMGQVVEVARPATVYGVPRASLYAEERPDIPEQDHSKRSAARAARLDTVAAMVATYPDSTAHELCEITGFGHPAMQNYLRDLRDAGVIESTVPDQRRFMGKQAHTYRVTT